MQPGPTVSSRTCQTLSAGSLTRPSMGQESLWCLSSNQDDSLITPERPCMRAEMGGISPACVLPPLQQFKGNAVSVFLMYPGTECKQHGTTLETAIIKYFKRQSRVK